MASVLQQYSQLADFTATQITGSYQSWTDFLTTAARLYKYPYHEQLMIYAQRPDATACADYELWNKRMGRYVRRGAKGIALIDHSGDAPKLKYVFDVADTRTTERSRSPYLWEYRPEHEQAVSAALEEQFAVPNDGSITEQLEQISSVKVTEYFLDSSDHCVPVQSHGTAHDCGLDSERASRYEGNVEKHLNSSSGVNMAPEPFLYTLI